MNFFQLTKLTEAEAIKHFKYDKFIVRLYDGFDNQWCDCSKEISWDEAVKLLIKETDNGTHHTDFANIDYYTIFPANSRMLYSGGYGEH